MTAVAWGDADGPANHGGAESHGDSTELQMRTCERCERGDYGRTWNDDSVHPPCGLPVSVEEAAAWNGGSSSRTTNGVP